MWFLQLRKISREKSPEKEEERTDNSYCVLTFIRHTGPLSFLIFITTLVCTYYFTDEKIEV